MTPSRSLGLWFAVLACGGLATAARARPPVVVLLGAPGAGKSTQADLIAERFHLPVLSTGRILRDEVERGTPLGRKVADAMARGELVPGDDVDRLVARRIAAPDCAQGFVLDGYPRTVEQAQILDRLLDERGFAPATVLLLEVSEDVLLDRTVGRGRADDSREVVANRLRIWSVQSAPIVEHYEGLDLHHIRGDQPREVVFRDVAAVLQPRLRAHAP